MYAVMTRNHDKSWSLESRHRLFERAQESARRFTSARVAIRNHQRLYHRADVVIMIERSRGGILHYLGPDSHNY